MSRKGNCWDHAVAESFFGSLKSNESRNTRSTNRVATATWVASALNSLEAAHKPRRQGVH